MAKRAMTAAESRHIKRVKSQSCCTCDAPPPSLAHHIREGQGTGQRAGHFCTIPLCPDCHVGRGGIHGDKTMMRIRKMDEVDLLDETYARLA